MRYYLIAGEASGDLHASNLMKALKNHDPDAVFRGWGGDLMAKQGADLVKHYRDLAFMGFMEVLAHLPAILGNFRLCEKDLVEFRADVLILVDYPGFNLRMAKFAGKKGIRVFYYISPQLWAWNSSRVKEVKRWVDRMFVILPFEKEFYAGYDYRVDFQGHPLLDVINKDMELPGPEDFRAANSLPNLPLIALLPGSRKMEIAKMLAVMTSVCREFPGYQFVVAGAPSIHHSYYSEMIGDAGIRVLTAQTYPLLHHSVAALVTSGTATLEAALVGVPQVVCYRGNFLSYLIARRLVKVKYISLVNLICNRPVVPELIQQQLTAANLAATLRSVIAPGPVRDSIAAGYRELKDQLGGRGVSERVAGLMIQYLSEK